MKRIFLSILVVGILLLSGCAKPTPAPTPVPSPEPVIPAPFVTYTDELGLFSISYPPKWELAISLIENYEQAMKELITSIESDAPVENVSVIFIAGIPKGIGYLPSVNIIVESLPGNKGTLEEVVEEEVRAVKDMFEGYREFSRVKARAGGKDVVILDNEMVIPSLVKTRNLQMFALTGKVVWIVTCKASPEEFADYEEDFHAIVRSLRILK